MKEEKIITGKDVLKMLFGNKWITLIMAACFFVVSFIGLTVVSGNKEEYVAFFEYDVAGFNRVVYENGDEVTYYIDGEKFDPRSIVSKDKLNKYFIENENLNSLDSQDLYSKNIVKSFGYTTRYKKNDHKTDDKDAAFIVDKTGYELVLSSYGINQSQAKTLAESIANEVIEISKTKIDQLRYVSYLNAYDNSKSYPDKISNLINGINYLQELSDNLKGTYGDVMIKSGNYGGEENSYYLSEKTISDWQKETNVHFGSLYLDSLQRELEVNGYLLSNSSDYISSLKTSVDGLDREMSVIKKVLDDIKDQRDHLAASVGVESLELREYNAEIIRLTEEYAEKQEKKEIYQNQLDKLNLAGLGWTDEQIASYNASLSAFEDKLNTIRNDLEFYTKQYEAIAKSIMKDNLNVYFETTEVVTINGSLGFAKILGISVAIAILLPVIVNVVLAGFNIAEGKPLFKIKKGEKTLNE